MAEGNRTLMDHLIDFEDFVFFDTSQPPHFLLSSFFLLYWVFREEGFKTAKYCPIPIGDSPSSKRMYDVMHVSYAYQFGPQCTALY